MGLRIFNQALLARQAWRLIEFPESLCARLLKAKYYPRGCLVDKVFSTNSSYTWQSIMHGLELLKKGIIWRVECGSQVRIWRDPWLPRAHSYRVTTRKGRCRLKWVSELQDSQGQDWDYEKINGTVGENGLWKLFTTSGRAVGFGSRTASAPGKTLQW
jgi:hypothetical protein